MTEERLAALKRYFEDRPDLGVASAYLFGSHAEGRAHRESDVTWGSSCSGIATPRAPTTLT